MSFEKARLLIMGAGTMGMVGSLGYFGLAYEVLGTRTCEESACDYECDVLTTDSV